MTTRRNAMLGMLASSLEFSAANVFAQDTSPITILVGAASSMDFGARAVAEQMRDVLGRPVVVVSKLGAGQRIALGEVKRAQPDGRTLVFATSGPFAVYPHVYNKLDYDPVNDFTPIAGISTFDVAISTGPATGVTNLAQLVEWMKSKKSGDAVYGSAPGNGSLSHFVGISIGLAANLQLTHVPYKDSGVGLIDLAAGRLPVMVTGLSPQIELHKAGKIKLLAVSGTTRSPLVPEVPTLREAGIAVSSTTSTAIFGPAKMPSELVKKLYEAINPMTLSPIVRDKFAGQAMTPWSANPSQLAQSLAEERKRYEVLVKSSGYVKEDA